MTDEETTADTVAEDDQDLHDWMRGATDTLVVDTGQISANAQRGGHRRRRVRAWLALSGVAAAIVLTTVSVQVVGDRVAGRGAVVPDVMGPGLHDERPGFTDDRTAIGNITIHRASGGVFTAKGGLAPRAGEGSRIELWAGQRGEPLTQRADYAPRPGFGVFGHRFRLAPGVWNIQLRYVDGSGDLDTGVYSTSIVLREKVPS